METSTCGQIADAVDSNNVNNVNNVNTDFNNLYLLSNASSIRYKEEYNNIINDMISKGGYWFQIYNKQLFINPENVDFPIIILDNIDDNLQKLKKKYNISVNLKLDNLIKIIQFKNDITGTQISDEVFNIIYYKFIKINNNMIEDILNN